MKKEIRLKILNKDGFIDSFKEMKEEDLESYLKKRLKETGVPVVFKEMHTYRSLYGLEQKEFIYKIV